MRMDSGEQRQLDHAHLGIQWFRKWDCLLYGCRKHELFFENGDVDHRRLDPYGHTGGAELRLLDLSRESIFWGQRGDRYGECEHDERVRVDGGEQRELDHAHLGIQWFRKWNRELRRGSERHDLFQDRDGDDCGKHLYADPGRQRRCT